ncbi:hypothetical protein P8452_18918 [Trifolium repens]|nr:hypothetical protein P8452_18918 [Trifolium repens]
MMISSSIINTISIRLVPPLSLSSSSSSNKTFFKCRSSSSNNNSDDNNFKDALSGMMGEQVEELLSREENKVLMDRLEKASQRVENAKTELAYIQKQELALKQFKDYTQQLEGKASQIAQSQREISEAKAMLEEAERNLLLNGTRGGGAQEQEIDRDEERLESLKAASISALVGTFSWLPLCFAQSTTTTQLLLSLAVNFISCALFGVTFRYTVRTNLDDFQLKTGVAAAFAVVKGLAILSAGPLLELNFQSLLSYASDGTIYVSENLVIFLSAAISLDYCLKTRLLSPFPIDRTG